MGAIMPGPRERRRAPRLEVGFEPGRSGQGALGRAYECLLPFFFSSRRRHTRSYGDWSSDVCSSDLRRMETGVLAVLGQLSATRNWCRIGREWWFADEPATELGNEECAYFASRGEKRARKFTARAARSEERRVGKEGRAGGATYG